ncbi:MAG: GNAT family N-acetyltransferase [archaeon]|nr:GNAT family N-acetyltransferase [archaeon]
MKIRECRQEDLDRVLEIENMSFDESYGMLMFQKLLDIGAGFLVCEFNDIVIGYILFWIKNEGEGHIISIAVDEKYRCLGAATLLLSRAILGFKIANQELVTLEVRESNTAPIEFYKSFVLL